MHDIYRMERFSQRRDTHHLVEVVRYHEKLLPQEALERVCLYINEAAGAFVATRRMLPQLDPPAEAYIDGIASLIRGMFDWLVAQGWFVDNNGYKKEEQQA